ncbi:CpsD/CapB family tyrosine-protein kinase [Lentibacter algarum]|nr:CpsD/CapB family tyrosine-protein kinase [Lentibacter algarum]
MSTAISDAVVNEEINIPVLPAVDESTAPERLEREAEPIPEPEPEVEPEREPEVSVAPAQDTAIQNKLRSAYETADIPDVTEPADLWNKLAVMPVDAAHLEENLIITASRQEQAHGAFDVLRTRLVQTLLEHGWKRVAITSPSRNCGKTFTAVNLAISLSRYEANRTVLLDMDMRNPSVANVIGDPNPGCMGDFLRGATTAEDFLVKFDRNNLNIGSSLAIGTNGIVEPYAAELAQDPLTAQSINRMMQEMSPDIVLFDMPPALAFDDVIAFRKQFDGVLMVVGGGSTSPEEVREVMRRLGEDTPLLGVVLNQAEGEDGSDYSYGY